MKSFRFFSLAVLGSSVLFGACTAQPQNLPTNPVSQTQQGIKVGLQIVDDSQSQQQTPQIQAKPKIVVMTPDLSQPLKSPVTLKGAVSGVYFSEGVFPVVLVDAKGKELARTLAHADDEWMTTDVVPFTVELSFKAPANTGAQLVFQKDNPSGLPENDQSQSFAVTLQ